MKCKSSLFGASQRTRPTQHFKRLRRRGYHHKILRVITFLQLNRRIGADIPGHAALCRLCRGACLGGWGVAAWSSFVLSPTIENIETYMYIYIYTYIETKSWKEAWHRFEMVIEMAAIETIQTIPNPETMDIHGQGKHSFLGRKLLKATKLTGSKVAARVKVKSHVYEVPVSVLLCFIHQLSNIAHTKSDGMTRKTATLQTLSV